MNHKRVKTQVSSYALAGIFLSLLATFVAYDVHAVRREARLQAEDTCRMSPCSPGQTLPPQPLRVVFRDF